MKSVGSDPPREGEAEEPCQGVVRALPPATHCSFALLFAK